ncbi:MmgE/PrpD family protein [Aquabacter spiritensis]|nr:MmgE/PrpD family protein [Aquabacter spiritensis]
MSGPLLRLARHVADRPADWGADLDHAAARTFVDTVACMLAGRDDPATRGVRAAFAPWTAPGPAPEVASGTRIAAPTAALVNGTAAHALDFDDVLEPAAAHASAVFVPALLALGTERGASGAQLADALLMAFDVMAAFAAAMNMAHYDRGWHTTLTFGPIAAAAGCARLMRLDAARAAVALSAATSFSSGSKRQFGSDMKPIHAGLAAQAGIVAARLAETGMSAAGEAILDGRWSFPDLFGGADMPGLGALVARLEGPPAMAAFGAWVKAYPCCASAHRPMDALKLLRQSEGFVPDAVAAVVAEVSAIVHGNLMYRDPATPMEARFSLNHCLAIVARKDRVEAADFAPAALADPDLRAFWPKVSMRIAPDLATPGAPAVGRERARLTVVLTDGRSLSETVVFPTGHPRMPMADADLAAKFDACAPATPDAAALRDLLFALPAAPDLTRITQLLAAVAAGAAQEKAPSK